MPIITNVISVYSQGQWDIDNLVSIGYDTAHLKLPERYISLITLNIVLQKYQPLFLKIFKV